VADVFISYKREERQAVERLAQELRRLGLDVWFDASLNAGEAFSDEIDREAHAAKIILVCWSPTARESKWVKAEALIGFEQGKLAACYVAGPDGFYPPTPFNSIHAEDLRAWVGTPSNTHAGYKSILRRIGALSGRADIESYGALDVQAPASVLRAWIAAHEQSPLFMAVDELLRVRDVEEAERARLEQEARERRAREEADRRAREDAERRTREEQERRERAEREQREREEREAKAALEAESVRDARRWLSIIGGVVVAAFVIGIMLNAGQDQGAPAEQKQVQEPQAQGAAPPPVQARDDQAIQLPEMVRIPGRNFEVGRYEVTFAQWDACVSGGGCNGYRPNDQGWGRGNRPVINVSWNDAQAYVQWLSERTGQRYRLMTSAEWEIAARAGSTSVYSWGNEPAVCNENALNGANFRDCTDDRTRPVGSFQPNGVGLYDMHGNVWEWVEDCDDSSCAARVLRGGSWLNRSPDLRIANRSSYYPNDREDFGSLAGFRVARTI
jgi:formylglycine-generating enzyme required for sulfatase activity